MVKNAVTFANRVAVNFNKTMVLKIQVPLFIADKNGHWEIHQHSIAFK